ncbi:MAG: four-helix bundle copper-binding protein [Nitrospira sp.]|jgi:hypothetical protein|nr:four-helix bundle copper-binding protein [Nitrospira sp. CR1.1]MCS6329008.1 four-helix bundle copper-binding protein [Nitrospira sp.]
MIGLPADKIAMMQRCIRLCRDCAAMCLQSAALMTSASELSQRMCQFCAEACDICAEERERHAKHHDLCGPCSRVPAVRGSVQNNEFGPRRLTGRPCLLKVSRWGCALRTAPAVPPGHKRQPSSLPFRMSTGYRKGDARLWKVVRRRSPRRASTGRCRNRSR